MPAPILASDVMDRAAALLNDVALSIYTYVVQLPYLKMAVDDLQLQVEANNISISNDVSAAINVLTGVTKLTYSSTPPYPADLVSIQQIFERDDATTMDWQEMKRVDFLPEITKQSNFLTWWTWQDQEIRFLGATADREVKIHYTSASIANVTSASSSIYVYNAIAPLAFKTAALCARFIGENPTRADSLQVEANTAYEYFLSILVKESQAMPSRRRPFMSSYKVRGSW
jgi:hypothetical protein